MPERETALSAAAAKVNMDYDKDFLLSRIIRVPRRVTINERC
jgi:hypothetical protein